MVLASWCFEELPDWEEEKLVNQCIHISSLVQNIPAASDFQSHATDHF